MDTTTANTRSRLRPLHEGPVKPLRHTLAALLHGGLIVAAVVTWEFGWWPVTVLLWAAIVWMNHASLTRLHESAHRLLYRSPVANEAAGIVIGSFALTTLSVYRYVHTQHHAHLGREKDPEFWPYNLPGSPRWLRMTYAALELGFGWIVTPWLYSIRTARAWPSLNRVTRRRLILEWIFLAVFWAAILGVVAWTNTWTWFVVGHFVPAWITGSVQTLRKFTEHLGRFGNTIPEMTRTVVYTRPLGRAASSSQLHVEHHGTHHRWPKVPYHRLPEATPIVYDDPQPGMIYSSHLAAILDMVPHLADPKLGPQWLKESA